MIVTAAIASFSVLLGSRMCRSTARLMPATRGYFRNTSPKNSARAKTCWGLLACRMAAMDRSGIRYVPQYVLTQDQVDAVGPGALAMIDRLNGFDDRALCELGPPSHKSPLVQPVVSN